MGAKIANWPSSRLWVNHFVSGFIDIENRISSEILYNQMHDSIESNVIVKVTKWRIYLINEYITPRQIEERERDNKKIFSWEM